MLRGLFLVNKVQMSEDKLSGEAVLIPSTVLNEHGAVSSITELVAKFQVDVGFEPKVGQEYKMRIQEHTPRMMGS